MGVPAHLFYSVDIDASASSEADGPQREFSTHNHGLEADCSQNTPRVVICWERGKTRTFVLRAKPFADWHLHEWCIQAPSMISLVARVTQHHLVATVLHPTHPEMQVGSSVEALRVHVVV